MNVTVTITGLEACRAYAESLVGHSGIDVGEVRRVATLAATYALATGTTAPTVQMLIDSSEREIEAVKRALEMCGLLTQVGYPYPVGYYERIAAAVNPSRWHRFARSVKRSLSRMWRIS